MDELNDIAVRILHHCDAYPGPNLAQWQDYRHAGCLACLKNLSDISCMDCQITQARGCRDTPRYSAMLRDLLIGNEFDQRVTAAKPMHRAAATHGHRDVAFVDEAEYISIKS